MEERLQKILSRAGIASRREAEKMIAGGRVRVNGQIVTELGSRADASTAWISVDGRRLKREAPERVTIALNKPRGVVSTRSDPEGRRTVVDLVPVPGLRLYPIGRLDYAAEGLILLTNDGDLAFSLLRPGSAERIYQVKVKGLPDEDSLARLREGIPLSGKRTLPARIRKLGGRTNGWFEVVLHEGRQNQIVLMFQAIGHPVNRLRRVRIGPVELGSLPPGGYRRLTASEIERLRSIRPAPGGRPSSGHGPRPRGAEAPRPGRARAARPAGPAAGKASARRPRASRGPASARKPRPR